MANESVNRQAATISPDVNERIAGSLQSTKDRADAKNASVGQRKDVVKDLFEDPRVKEAFNNDPNLLKEYIGKMEKMAEGQKSWLQWGWEKVKQTFSFVWNNKWKIALGIVAYYLYQFANWDDIKRALHTAAGKTFGAAKEIAMGAPGSTAAGTAEALRGTAGSGGIPAMPGMDGDLY